MLTTKYQNIHMFALDHLNFLLLLSNLFAHRRICPGIRRRNNLALMQFLILLVQFFTHLLYFNYKGSVFLLNHYFGILLLWIYCWNNLKLVILLFSFLNLVVPLISQLPLSFLLLSLQSLSRLYQLLPSSQLSKLGPHLS